LNFKNGKNIKYLKDKPQKSGMFWIFVVWKFHHFLLKDSLLFRVLGNFEKPIPGLGYSIILA